MKQWLDQQVAEKQMMKNNNKQINKAYETQTATIHQEMGQVQDEYERRRKDMRECTRVAQEQQYKEKEQRDALDSLMGDEMAKRHINTCMESDFFTENPNTCTNNLQPHRYLKYHWKGMDSDQLGQIRLDQLRQMADKKSKEDAEKEEEKLWAMQEEQNRKQLLKVQREFDRQRKGKMLDEVVEYNRLKARECDRREKIIYDNVHNYKVY